MTLQTRVILLAIIAALIFLIGGFVGYKIKQCPECNSETVIHYDTIPVKNPIAVKSPVSKPKLIGIKKFNASSKNVELDTNKRAIRNINLADSTCTLFSCLDTTIYSDSSFVKDSYLILDTSVVSENRLIAKSRSFTDLRPQIIKTVEKSILIKPKSIKAFIGIDAGGNKSNWGMGPSTIIEIKDKFALHYNYDARNNGHQAGFFIYAFGF